MIRKSILAFLASAALVLGVAAPAHAADSHVKNSYASTARILISENGSARYLNPGYQAFSADSYYVLSGTRVRDPYSGRCYNAGTRVYLYNGSTARVVVAEPGSC